MSCFYVEKQVPISIDVVLDNVFKDSSNLLNQPSISRHIAEG